MEKPNNRVKVLTDRDHVRLRPGMYLPNINYFVYELADNSVDVYMDGYGDLIIVSIDEQGKVSVRDYGPGLPVIPSEQFPDILEGELCMGNLKAGTKFTKDNKRKSAGLNGVGASCVNCLSKTFDVEVYKDGKLYTMSFEEGLVKKHLSCDGDTKEATGTYIECVPDRAIWEKLDDFDINQINSRMKQLAYLNPGLTIELNIDYEGHEVHEKYYFPEGVKTYVEELAKNKDELTDIWYDIKTVDVEPNRPMDIYMALMYTDTYSDTIYAYTNNVLNTNQSSSHITGFKSGLSSAIKSYYDDVSTNKNKKNIVAEDTRLGIIAIVSIKVADPHYIGQGKDQLDEKAIRSAIYRETEEFVLDQLDKNPNEAKIILNKVLESCGAREAAKRATENASNTTALSGGKVNGLTKGISKETEDTCIGLVEGDSAGGSAKKARNEQIDAILPVFGKIPNTYNMSLDKVYSIEKMVSVIKALGCGIGPDCDIDKLNYKHIVILTDGDVDGWHIQCLWITFFYKYMRPVIDNGYLYIALPPLFTIVKNPGTKKEEHIYAYTIEEKDEVAAKLDCKYEVMRNKGLGEMDWPELQHSTMDINTRKLIQVKIDEDEDSALCLDVCMNSKSIQARKEFILLNNE